MGTIQEFINNRHKYKVDYTYQRPQNAWSNEDRQCLIDTILRGEPMPLFFFNHKSQEQIYYIVDGQQRLNSIQKFFENNIKLNKKFSGKENHGGTFNGDNPINDKQREAFLNYKLNFRIMEDYDDERVRLIFSRLQRGKPLQLGERLNAKPGEIVPRMREIAANPFLKKSVGIYKERYGVYPDAARILFYEKQGAKQCGSNELHDFFDNFKDITKTDKDYKNAIYVLNFLTKCFPAEPGNYKYFEKHTWVFAAYTMMRELIFIYALDGQEKQISSFIEDFHNKVYSEDFRISNIVYQRFYDNVRGGWSEKLIKIRRDTLINEFLKKSKLKELDTKRQISDEEKIASFAKQSTCEMCSISFKDYKSAEYHHKISHKDGGKSELDNIMVLCTNCHDIIHGKGEITIQNEEIAIENNNDDE